MIHSFIFFSFHLVMLGRHPSNTSHRPLAKFSRLNTRRVQTDVDWIQVSLSAAGLQGRVLTCKMSLLEQTEVYASLPRTSIPWHDLHNLTYIYYSMENAKEVQLQTEHTKHRGQRHMLACIHKIFYYWNRGFMSLRDSERFSKS